MRPEGLNLTATEYLDPGGPPLRVIRRDPEGEFPLHRHDFSELVVICGGSGTHLAYGEQLALNDGHFSFAHMRKLSPDGPFDRELVRNGAHFCYFLNRIWDK